MKTIDCAACGKVINVFPSQEGRKRYCSKSCMAQDKEHGKGMVAKSCVFCGKEYSVQRTRYSRSLYCSKSCHAKRERHKEKEERPCPVCGTVFETFIEKSKRHIYCSKECVSTARSIASGRRNSKVTINCKTCGQPFKAFPCRVGEEKYCKPECGKIGGKKRPKHASTILSCDYCGNEFRKPNSRVRNSNHHFCSNSCYHLWDKEYKRSPHMLEKLAERLKSGFGGVSKLEDKIAAWLDERGISYDRQVALKTYIIDFKIGNTYLEVNGCYWHNCPICKEGVTAVQIRRAHIDASKRTYCKKKGVELIEIWEHEINKRDYSALAVLLG